MAQGRFWKITAYAFIIAIQLFWSGILFIFVILPRLIVLPIRRTIVKIRTQRIMVKNGMPRKDARIFARKYRSILYEYGSIIGLLKLTRNKTGKTDVEEDENKITESKKIQERNLKTIYS